MSTQKEEEVVAYEVLSAFREQIGPEVKLAQFITPEKIATCEQLLNDASDAFFTDAAADLNELRKVMNAKAEAVQYDHASIYIHNIKVLARVLGFTLITEICVHSLRALESKNLADAKRHALLQKMVETLAFAFDNRIRDEGGDAGAAILYSLRSYMAKQG